MASAGGERLILAGGEQVAQAVDFTLGAGLWASVEHRLVGLVLAESGFGGQQVGEDLGLDAVGPCVAALAVASVHSGEQRFDVGWVAGAAVLKQVSARV